MYFYKLTVFFIAALLLSTCVQGEEGKTCSTTGGKCDPPGYGRVCCENLDCDTGTCKGNAGPAEQCGKMDEMCSHNPDTCCLGLFCDGTGSRVCKRACRLEKESCTDTGSQWAKCCDPLAFECRNEICVEKVDRCVAGNSDGQCDVEPISINKTCCKLGYSYEKNVGKCIVGPDGVDSCKCVPDGEECNDEAICCNERRGGLTCRNDPSGSGKKCLGLSKEEKLGCISSTSDPPDSAEPGNQCEEGAVDISKYCCEPGDNPEKNSGRCVHGRCSCWKTGDICGHPNSCCEEGKNGISCRHRSRNGHSLKKCIKDEEVEPCIPTGKICNRVKHIDACCNEAGCQEKTVKKMIGTFVNTYCSEFDGWKG